jgi:hypothetical protein
VGDVSVLALAFRKETPMHRHSLAHLALFAVLALSTACGGAQTHAESPAPDVTPSTESGSSAPSDSSASTKSSDAQLPASALDQKGTTTSAPPPTEGKSESTSAADDAIISGNALPPSPNAKSATKAAKPTKAKKPGKTNKKTAQASRG